MKRYKLPGVECHTVSLWAKWEELDCDGDKIDMFLCLVEDWYRVNFDKNSPLAWCWTYDPDFEWQDAGVVGITFNAAEYAEEFREIFGYVEQG